MQLSFLHVIAFLVLTGFISQTIDHVLTKNAEFEQVENENDNQEESENDQKLDSYVYSIYPVLLPPVFLKSDLPESKFSIYSALISGPLSPPPEKLIG